MNALRIDVLSVVLHISFRLLLGAGTFSALEVVWLGIFVVRKAAGAILIVPLELDILDEDAKPLEDVCPRMAASKVFAVVGLDSAMSSDLDSGLMPSDITEMFEWQRTYKTNSMK